MLPLLLECREGRQALLDALRGGHLQPLDLDASARRTLLAETPDDLKAPAAALLGGAPNADRAAIVERYRPALSQRGDAARGQAVFRKTCSACHRADNFGNAVGPHLSALRGKSKEFWLESVFDPNRAVEARYVAYLVELHDGRRRSGVIVEESATALMLAGADGKIEAILRHDILHLVSTGKSLMPEGLEKDVSPAAWADLLAYLTPPTTAKR